MVGKDHGRRGPRSAGSRRSRSRRLDGSSISLSSASRARTTPVPMRPVRPRIDSGGQEVEREVAVAEFDGVARRCVRRGSGPRCRSGWPGGRRPSPCPRRPTVPQDGNNLHSNAPRRERRAASGRRQKQRSQQVAVDVSLRIAAMRTLRLTGRGLSRRVGGGRQPRRPAVAGPGGAAARWPASRRVVDRAIRSGARVYGVTTGFGKFADVAIPRERIETLQRNLIRSHAAGVGTALPDRAVRAMIALRINALARGYSGIRVETVEALLAMLAADVLPVVPAQGSVGASGDLAPLAHLALGLIGEGRGARARARGSPARRRPAPGGPAAGALGGQGGARTHQRRPDVGRGRAASRCGARCGLARIADLVGAASLDASRGSDAAFDPRIVAARPHPGAAASAANLRALIRGSAIRESHRGCGRVQDNYALRCMPQVHGAAREAFAHAREVLEREMNSATDNPLVFAEARTTSSSGGNFHGAPVGLRSRLRGHRRDGPRLDLRAPHREAPEPRAVGAARVSGPRGRRSTPA